jgi:hypothetical protein
MVRRQMRILLLIAAPLVFAANAFHIRASRLIRGPRSAKASTTTLGIIDMIKIAYPVLLSAILLGPSISFAQFVDSKGNTTSQARHDIAKQCAVSAGLPIAADGSWNRGSPRTWVKYMACKAKNDIN